MTWRWTNTVRLNSRQRCFWSLAHKDRAAQPALEGILLCPEKRLCSLEGRLHSLSSWRLRWQPWPGILSGSSGSCHLEKADLAQYRSLIGHVPA